jgi:hypothetical protein
LFDPETHPSVPTLRQDNSGAAAVRSKAWPATGPEDFLPSLPWQKIPAQPFYPGGPPVLHTFPQGGILEVKAIRFLHAPLPFNPNYKFFLVVVVPVGMWSKASISMLTARFLAR